MKLTEDTLVQQTTAEYLEKALKWDSVYAYDTEDFGPNSLLGRSSDREVVLRRDLHAALVKLNPGMSEIAYEDAIRQVTEINASQDITAANKEKYSLLSDGVQVTYRNDRNELAKQRLRVFDVANPVENRFFVFVSCGFVVIFIVVVQTSSGSSTLSRSCLWSARRSTRVWSVRTAKTSLTIVIRFRTLPP